MKEKFSACTDQELEQVKELSQLLFAPQDIAVILGIHDIEGFRKACVTVGTPEYNQYKAGRLEQEIILRRSILMLAKQGSSPAQTLAKKLLDESEAKNFDR